MSPAGPVESTRASLPVKEPRPNTVEIITGGLDDHPMGRAIEASRDFQTTVLAGRLTGKGLLVDTMV